MEGLDGYFLWQSAALASEVALSTSRSHCADEQQYEDDRCNAASEPPHVLPDESEKELGDPKCDKAEDDHHNNSDKSRHSGVAIAHSRSIQNV